MPKSEGGRDEWMEERKKELWYYHNKFVINVRKLCAPGEQEITHEALKLRFFSLTGTTHFTSAFKLYLLILNLSMMPL